jgi:hypothetical protein
MMPPAFQYILHGSCNSQAVNSQIYPNPHSPCRNFCCPMNSSRFCGNTPANQYYLPGHSQQRHQSVFSGDRICITINVISDGKLDCQLVQGCSQPLSSRSTELPLATQVKMPHSVPSTMLLDRCDSTIIGANQRPLTTHQVQPPEPILMSGSDFKHNSPANFELALDSDHQTKPPTDSFFQGVSGVIGKVLKGVPLSPLDLELSPLQVQVILTFLMRKFNIQASDL